MQGKIIQSIIVLIIIFAVFVLLNTLTNAQEVLLSTNITYFAIASAFFILSILSWLIAWSHLIKKSSKISSFKLLLVGFSAVYGSLTPVQVGAEAIRSLLLKKYFKKFMAT